MNIDHSDPLLNVSESCDFLSISRPTLYDLLASGEVRSIKIGRSRRIPRAALLEFINAKLDEDPGLGAS